MVNVTTSQRAWGLDPMDQFWVVNVTINQRAQGLDPMESDHPLALYAAWYPHDCEHPHRTQIPPTSLKCHGRAEGGGTRSRPAGTGCPSAHEAALLPRFFISGAQWDN